MLFNMLTKILRPVYHSISPFSTHQPD